MPIGWKRQQKQTSPADRNNSGKERDIMLYEDVNIPGSYLFCHKCESQFNFANSKHNNANTKICIQINVPNINILYIVFRPHL